MKSIPTIAQQWQEFANAIFEGAVSETQYHETRKAFYAGVWSVLCLQHDMLGSPDVSEEEGVRVLEGWTEECQAFYQEIRRQAGLPAEG